MIIYATDRYLNILATASTELYQGLRIIEDLTTEEINPGVNTFTCQIAVNDQDRSILEISFQEGNFILKGSGNAFNSKENSYDSLYQIIDTEFDSELEVMTIYAEDAGLELINKVVPAVKLVNKTLKQMIQYFVPSDWEVITNGTPTGTKTYEWEGENTATERIISVANLFGCELYYSFEIERFKVTAKIINVVPKRGNQVATEQLRLHYNINRIVTKKTTANMATAFAVTGGTPDGSETPINLKGYSYTYTDAKGDRYQVDATTGQMRNITQMARWASTIDADGLIVKSFSFDTTDKATLAGQARAALQEVSYPEVNYEIDIIDLPEGVKVGDRINIIDDKGELYLDTRILILETSITNGTITATFGEHLIRQSGISDVVQKFAQEFVSNLRDGIDGITCEIFSSNGIVFRNTAISTTLSAVFYYGNKMIADQTTLEEYFSNYATVEWYENGSSTLLGTGFNYTLNTNDNRKTIVCKLMIENSCRAQDQKTCVKVDSKTAYESAVDGGYTGTENQFNLDLADIPNKPSREELDEVDERATNANTALEVLDEKYVAITDLGEYMSFGHDGSNNPVLTLGALDNHFQVQLTNTELAFLQDNLQIAYLTNQQLYINSAVIVEGWQVDNFAWVTRTVPNEVEKNLSLKWRG